MIRSSAEEQDVDALDRVLEQAELLVLLEGWLILRSRASRRWARGMPHDRGGTGWSLVAHRHHRLDHVAVVQLVDGGDLLARERLPHVLVVASRVGTARAPGS